MPELTDRRIVTLTGDLGRFEQELRDVLNARQGAPEELSQAYAALRQTIALRKPLEKWIADRACRAARAIA